MLADPSLKIAGVPGKAQRRLRGEDSKQASAANAPTPGKTRLAPVLKNTEGVLNGYENFLLYLILQLAYKSAVLTRSDPN